MIKEDRGLLPVPEDIFKRKLKTYQMQNSQVGPANYNNEKWNTIASKYAKK